MNFKGIIIKIIFFILLTLFLCGLLIYFCSSTIASSNSESGFCKYHDERESTAYMRKPAKDYELLAIYDNEKMAENIAIKYIKENIDNSFVLKDYKRVVYGEEIYYHYSPYDIQTFNSYKLTFTENKISIQSAQEYNQKQIKKELSQVKKFNFLEKNKIKKGFLNCKKEGVSRIEILDDGYKHFPDVIYYYLNYIDHYENGAKKEGSLFLKLK